MPGSIALNRGSASRLALALAAGVLWASNMGFLVWRTLLAATPGVSRSGAQQVYTGRKGSGPDFPLVPTECYFVRMTTTTAYLPSHY